MNQGTEITVRAMPAPGHQFRRRCGIAWGKQARRAVIVDAPRPLDLQALADGKIEVIELSPSQYQQLVEDPHIAVTAIGGSDPQIPELKAQLLKAMSEVEALRKQLAEQAEAFTEERRALSTAHAAQGKQVLELSNQIETLRADLAAATSSRKRG